MNNFDERAQTWDDDPQKVKNGKKVAEAIREKIQLRSDMRVLDYGCGTGLLSFPLQPYVGPMLLIDNSAGMLEVLEQKIAVSAVTNMQTLKLDLLHESLPDQQFDLIVTMLTLHHVADIDRILSIFQNLLVPQGYLCIIDLDKEDGSFHGEGFKGTHGFDRDALSKQLDCHGFHNTSFQTCFSIQKPVKDIIRNFSAFLAIASK